MTTVRLVKGMHHETGEGREVEVRTVEVCTPEKGRSDVPVFYAPSPCQDPRRWIQMTLDLGKSSAGIDFLAYQPIRQRL